MPWDHKEISTGFAVTGDALNKLLYGDARTYSRWELFVMRMRRYRDRARDAWLVLTGKAFIGYD